MKRRALLFAAGFFALPGSIAIAQAPDRRRIGWLSSTSAGVLKFQVDVFLGRMKELGYVDGRDIVIEKRWSDGRPELLPTLAMELLALKPAVIVTAGSSAISVLQKASASIPIVFGSAFEPVEQGFVKSLSRPGGNISGITIRIETADKLLELLRECLPAVRRIALLVHDGEVASKRTADRFSSAAAASGHELNVIPMKRADDLAHAFAVIASHKSECVIVPNFGSVALQIRRIVELALKARIPVIANIETPAITGILLAYYSPVADNYRRVAVLVDKILRGANPADLPVEQPDRYKLVVNRRSAKVLGIAVPPSLILRADEVLE